jgi:hypothetical protein
VRVASTVHSLLQNFLCHLKVTQPCEHFRELSPNNAILTCLFDYGSYLLLRVDLFANVRVLRQQINKIEHDFLARAVVHGKQLRLIK